MSKLEQVRSVQASGQSIAAAATAQKTITASDCTRDSALFGAHGIAATALRKDAILGAQSVFIARTPFDNDWAAVQHPNVASIQNAVAKSGARSAIDKRQQVQMVNRWINQNIVFGDDQIVYGRADYWAPASETLRRGVGDCEDFAIAKMDMLAALGVARADMRLIIARDLVRNADHAVLIVNLDGGSVMLDNVTDRLLDGRTPNDYRPIMSFSQNAKWVHGYDVQQQTAAVRLAALPAAFEP
jgi:predicted transglutaminase-like cysteine proteinase